MLTHSCMVEASRKQRLGSRCMPAAVLEVHPGLCLVQASLHSTSSQDVMRLYCAAEVACLIPAHKKDCLHKHGQAQVVT